jgi:hypothetical protein
LPTGTPISLAASRSCATARIAIPHRVLARKTPRPPIIAIDTTAMVSD